MTIRTEAKRVKMGQSLTDFDTQAVNAINQLKGIRANLVKMRAAVHDDADFIEDDENEIDVVIAKINTSINSITKDS